MGCVPVGDRAADSAADSTRPTAQLTDVSVPETGFDSLLENATQLYRRGEYDSVRAVLGPVLQRARTVGDSAQEARIVTLLGHIARQEGELETARTLGEQALSMKLAMGLDEHLSDSYNALGLVAWDEARRSDALELFDLALASAPEERYESWLAAVSINRGLIFTDLGRFGTARAEMERGREIAHRLGNERYEGRALNNLAMLDIWIGDPLQAIATLGQARRFYHSQGDIPGEVNALGQLGTAYTALGQLSAAIAVLDSAVQLARERGMRTEEAGSLEALAEAYRTAGDHRRALELYAEAEAINAEVGLPDQTGADQRSRAEIYASMGELTLARDFARRALETHRSVDAKWEELADLVLLADLDHEAGDTVTSLVHLDQAKALAREFDARTGRIDVTLAEARIADRRGEPGQVLTVLADGSADLFGGGYDVEWEAEALRARAFAGLDRLDSAVAAGRRAVAAVERVRVALGSGRLRTSYTSRRPEPYAELVTALLAAGEVDEAFAVADAARGRALLEHLATRRVLAADQGEPQSRIETGESLLRQVAKLSADIHDEESYPPEERDSAYLAGLREDLAAARGQYESWYIGNATVDSSKRDGPWTRTASAADARGALRQDEALLQYLVMADRVVGFVATTHETHAFEASISDKQLARRVRVARGVLGDPDSDAELRRQALTGLHDALLAPALAQCDFTTIERLIVVPHGVLTYLPFAALVDGRSGRYLAEDYAVRLLPSASSLPVLRDARREVAPEDDWRRGVALAPFPRELPATRAEVRAFRRTLPEGRSVQGKSATERQLRERLGEAAIVHVATHGVMNVHNPMFSHIELAGDRTVQDDDGRLAVHEVLDVSVRSPLVFLSGCETGLGRSWSTGFATGEDYATLAHAFLYAGAGNVVATLWRVEDRGAAAFAERFYQYLTERGPAAALAAAQRDMLSDLRYSAPYYWAAYQLSGAARPESDAQATGAASVRY